MLLAWQIQLAAHCIQLAAVAIWNSPRPACMLEWRQGIHCCLLDHSGLKPELGGCWGCSSNACMCICLLAALTAYKAIPLCLYTSAGLQMSVSFRPSAAACFHLTLAWIRRHLEHGSHPVGNSHRSAARAGPLRNAQVC